MQSNWLLKRNKIQIDEVKKLQIKIARPKNDQAVFILNKIKLIQIKMQQLCL